MFSHVFVCFWDAVCFFVACGLHIFACFMHGSGASLLGISRAGWPKYEKRDPGDNCCVGDKGGYGVYMFTVQSLMFISLHSGAPDMPETLREDLTSVPVRYTKHSNEVARCVYAWRETAQKSALNRPLIPS